MHKITEKQRTVLDYLQRYIGEHRRAPFLREIQAACRIASYKSVIDRLNALERKGFIRRIPNKHRAIHIPRKSVARLQAMTTPLDDAGSSGLDQPSVPTALSAPTSQVGP